MDKNLTPEDVRNNITDFIDEAKHVHHEDYRVMRDFWIGAENALQYIHKHTREDETHWQNRRKRLVGANYVRPIVDKIARSEYGAAVVRNLGTDEGLQGAWDKIARANKVASFQLRTARQRAIDGTCIVQAYWDADEKRVRWQHILPEHFYPVVLPGDNYDDVSAVIIMRAGSADTVGESHRLRGNEGVGTSTNINSKRGDRVVAGKTATEIDKARLEIYTASGVGVWEGDKRVDDTNLQYWERKAEYGCLPFVIFNGQTLVGDLLGYSMERGLVELNHFINRHMSGLSEIIDYQAFSLLVIRGGLNDLPQDEDGKVRLPLDFKKFIVTGDNGGAEFINPQPKIQEVVEVLNRVIEMMFEVGNVPIACVQPQQSHEESGVSRQIQFMPLRDLVEELQTQDREAEMELIAKSLLIGKTHGVPSKKTTLDSVMDSLTKATITYPQRYLPIDKAADVEVFMMRHDAGLESRKDKMAEEHPELDAAGVESKMREIDEERKKEGDGPMFDYGQTKNFPHARPKSKPVRTSETQEGGQGGKRVME